MASLLAGTFFAVANCCEWGFSFQGEHFGMDRFARRGSTHSCEGRLPFSRSSPPGHAVVLRFGWCGVAGGVMDSAVLVVERCADSEVGGREGGPLAGLFPGWSIFVELYICFGNILWSR